MPRTETIEKTYYKFAELSDDAKEKARDWYRQGLLDDSFWYEHVYEDAEQCAAILGIEIGTRQVPRMDGKFNTKPLIYFSGFSSQGDGACFEGRYNYKKKCLDNIKAHAPKDTDLHNIAAGLTAIQKKHGYKLSATMRHSGHYYHAYCMTVDTYKDGYELDYKSDADETLRELMRDFANWIYTQLEKQADWLQSAEAVDESIEANDYEFDEEGNMQ